MPNQVCEMALAPTIFPVASSRRVAMNFSTSKGRPKIALGKEKQDGTYVESLPTGILPLQILLVDLVNDILICESNIGRFVKAKQFQDTGFETG